MRCVVIACILLVGSETAMAGSPATITNTLGLRLVRIEAGRFTMGADAAPLSESVARRPDLRRGDFDERPAHAVIISRPFQLGATEVTNAQYERFDPGHRALRGKLGLSTGDDEAVVFVNWHKAIAFCAWLSEREGRSYRLPTEAEWEYACRAGTHTPYWTGDTLPAAFAKNARVTWFPDPMHLDPAARVDLAVGRTPANPWGLADLHGNVEEWCADWYGPYEPGEQTDPVGRAGGDFRVTRGASHATDLYYLRAANRAGAPPDDRSWLLGFRVALGAPPDTPFLPPTQRPLNQRGVSQRRPAASPPDPAVPWFRGPRRYVNIPADQWGPMFSRHNHDPAIVDCPNGDLLAIWYSCVEEPGRELCILASRLRRGNDEWDPASPFWDTPDRNDHAPALFSNGRTLYHFNGLSAAATWGNLATILRTSTDHGATWSPARLILREHGTRHMPVESVFRTAAGWLVLPCDAVTGGDGGTALQLSRDGGQNWFDAGGKIAGIHAGVAELRDGRLLAFGRGDTIDEHMPMSRSSDMGRTWTYQAGPFPPISSGQRLVLLRLREGPLLFCSFADGLTVTTASGGQREVKGLYAAVSRDDGATWPLRRLVSDDGPGREIETTDGRRVTLSRESAEPRGYLSVCQAADGLIHLISSRQHYTFNLAWLTAAPPD